MNQSFRSDSKRLNDPLGVQRAPFMPLNIFRLRVSALVQNFSEEISSTAPHPVQCKQLKFRSMTSRWGTCSSKGVITINTKLKNLPQQVIEFVVFHECLHLMHLNHGINFRKRLTKKFPNKKELEHSLKLFGLSEL